MPHSARLALLDWKGSMNESGSIWGRATVLGPRCHVMVDEKKTSGFYRTHWRFFVKRLRVESKSTGDSDTILKPPCFRCTWSLLTHYKQGCQNKFWKNIMEYFLRRRISDWEHHDGAVFWLNFTKDASQLALAGDVNESIRCALCRRACRRRMSQWGRPFRTDGACARLQAGTVSGIPGLFSFVNF